MGALNVSMCRLICDTCGFARDALTMGATAARIEASGEGWKYAQYDIKGKGLVKRQPQKPRFAGDDSFTTNSVPRQWDSCPACPLPSSAEDATKIVDARKVAGEGG